MRLFRFLPFLLFTSIVTAFVACQQSPAPAPGVPLSLAEQRKAKLSGIGYVLHFVIPAQQETAVKGTETVQFTLRDTVSELVLDFKQREGSVQTVTVNGESEKVRQENEHLIIRGKYLVAGPNKVDIVFEAGSDALNRNKDFMYALFVPERARTAFPCFDQPDLKAAFTLTLDIPSAWKAMSNGPVMKKTTIGENMQWAFAPSDTIPTYLFSFTAGIYKSETRTAGGREMEFFYRETDSIKLASSIPAIFDAHVQSLQFLEKYTGIAYPFKKFSFTAIPDFQFGGMEHPGAIWYNANALFLDSSATRTQLIRRATLLAHETSHMWFGDLVTMKWFNDVWMKEVFANFMADKITSVILPDNNADLKFIADHYPAAYSVDRTKGANPIRQPLDNLNEAGSLYGNIIYHKAPIMMLQLERLIGDSVLQRGLGEYLKKYAFSNATWPDLISILDANTPEDLQSWNDVWVNKPGRPVVDELLTDVKGKTYGLFKVDTNQIVNIYSISNPALRALSYINLYENVIDGRGVAPTRWLDVATTGLHGEKEELINQLLLGELNSIYWVYLSPEHRQQASGRLANTLWRLMEASTQPNMKKQFFKAWTGLALSDSAKQTLYTIWKDKMPPTGVKLTEDDYTDLAATLALNTHSAAADILKEQGTRIQNADKQARWAFLQPSLSADVAARDAFFASLKDVANRRKESWVVTAVNYLHHPLREKSAEKYLLPSLEWLEDIQRTGDIFFPQNWLGATLGQHQSAAAAKIVQDFIDQHPGYNPRLMNKLLQAADPLFRTQRLLSAH